jgi:uncharacterized protein (TIGR03067 family)
LVRKRQLDLSSPDYLTPYLTTPVSPFHGEPVHAPTRPADRDLDLLQGTWRIESSTWNGVAEPEIARTVMVLFEGDKFVVVDRDGNRQTETIHLMPDQNPKSIDSMSQTRGHWSPGIYSLEGDVFTWCSAGGSNTIRPTRFSSQPGSNQSLMVLRRVKNSARR